LYQKNLMYLKFRYYRLNRMFPNFLMYHYYLMYLSFH